MAGQGADVVELIRSLFAYDRWANGVLLDLVEGLPEERLTESFGGSFDTIIGTAAHILQGERFYFSRWTGGERPTRPEGPPTLADIRAMLAAHEQSRDAALAELTPESAGALVSYQRGGDSVEAPAWQLMLSLISHSTHHRAELADMLTRAGSPPPALDLADYYQRVALGQA